MLWIINGLIYGFFTALYTLVNQEYKLNGYLLGIWRGFGIAILFTPFLFLFPIPQNIYYWALLILQGLLIGFYDSRLFFATAKYGAGPTSRTMALAVIFTVLFWWCLTPTAFLTLYHNTNTFIALILILLGFVISYWHIQKNPTSKAVLYYMLPVMFALSAMSIITKYIEVQGTEVWSSMTYYLTISTFISGCYNSYFYITTEKTNLKKFMTDIFAKKVIQSGFYIISFSAALIATKSMAMRLAPNPGYVITLVLISPVFVWILNKYHKNKDNVSIKSGFLMIFFLVLLMILINGDFGVTD